MLSFFRGGLFFARLYCSHSCAHATRAAGLGNRLGINKKGEYYVLACGDVSGALLSDASTFTPPALFNYALAFGLPAKMHRNLLLEIAT